MVIIEQIHKEVRIINFYLGFRAFDHVSFIFSCNKKISIIVAKNAKQSVVVKDLLLWDCFFFLYCKNPNNSIH